MKLVYVAGPFRAPDSWEREQNIRRAEALSLEVWRMGAACVCPHTNTRFFDGAASDAVWLEGDMEILRRCDAVLMTEDWYRSTGARAEAHRAAELDIPVLYSLRELDEWLNEPKPSPCSTCSAFTTDSTPGQREWCKTCQVVGRIANRQGA